VEGIVLDDVVALALSAGAAIMEVYGGEFGVDVKADKSPLTEADRRSNQIIVEGLGRLYPGIPILSEEGKEIPYPLRAGWKALWLVDPLDGTKEFIKRNGEFTANIALIEDGFPVLGVVYAPAKRMLYYAEMGRGAYKVVGNGAPQKIRVRDVSADKIVVVASRTHLNDETKGFIGGLLRHYKKIETISAGSSLKFCLVAEGAADVYPRIAPTMEWDSAAAHAILSAAGGKVVEFQKENELRYNKENLKNPNFVAYGKSISL
jgi:3'(2'), 5'-bisphosphate nucleotidase